MATRSAADSDYRWRSPDSAAGRPARAIEAKVEAKAAGRRGKPIGPGFARSRSLYRDHDRSAGLDEQRRVAGPERIAIGGVGDQVAVAVVHRQRPEILRRRRVAGREGQTVVVRAVEQGSARVRQRGRIDRLVGRVRAQSDDGDDGAELV